MLVSTSHRLVARGPTKCSSGTVKQPASFAGMKGRVSDHVARYTPKSNRKRIDSPTSETAADACDCLALVTEVHNRPLVIRVR